MKKLFVFYEDICVGTLSRDENLVYSFAYDDSWLTNVKKFPLSIAMPLTQKSYENRIALSYFENLLPEGDVRRVIENEHQISGTFEFLERFGQDCAGAVVVSQHSKTAFSSRSKKLVEIHRSKIDQAISKNKSVADMIATEASGYLSLAGAQDKFPGIYKDNHFFLPADGSPTTHIIKMPILRNGIKESVYNEYFCMELARSVGFNIPKCLILPGPYPLFIVERYDRNTSTGNILRIHQQDFCQAQGFTSEFKYEAKGGPSLKMNYNLILDHVTVSLRLSNIGAYLDWLCFNLLIGNNDTHSKNISLIFQAGKNELAPFYDLLSTAIYPTLKSEFSFNIGDRNDFSKIGLKQIHLLEGNLQIKANSFRQRLLNMMDLLIEKKELIANQVISHHPEAKIPLRISKLISKRIKGLKQQGI